MTHAGSQKALASGGESTRWIDVRRLLPQVLGIVWLVAAAAAVLAPALHHGLHLGPYDVLSQWGLTRQSGVVVHNTLTRDQIAAIIPWSQLAWTQVHHLQLPLWNPYSGLGLPLAFNWQSGVLSAPTLLSYLLPVSLSFAGQIFFTIIIAGTGVYFLGRVLKLGVLGCTLAGTAYELSGPLMANLGEPHAVVMSWAGWLFGATVLIVRGQHRVRNVTLASAFLACAVYSGQPEIVTILFAALALFLGTLLLQRTLSTKSLKSIGRPIVDLSAAAVVGFALSAPLSLPGLQLLSASTRRSADLSLFGVGQALPFHDLAHLLAQGYNGIPIASSQTFGGAVDVLYLDSAAYVGVIAMVFAVAGVAFCRHRQEVVGFAVVALAAFAVIFLPPVETLIARIPG